MSLQTLAATVATSRPQGIRRYTAPLVLGLMVLAAYQYATATEVRDALAAYAAVH